MSKKPALLRTLDYVVPVALTGWFVLHNRNDRDYKRVLVIGLVILIVSFIAVSQFTKLAKDLGMMLKRYKDPDGSKDDSNTPGTVGGGSSFDPTVWTDDIYKDVNSPTYYNDDDLYDDLALLSNNEVLQIMNDWQKRYYSKTGKTLAQRLDAETNALGWLTCDSFCSFRKRVKSLQ